MYLFIVNMCYDILVKVFFDLFDFMIILFKYILLVVFKIVFLFILYILFFMVISFFLVYLGNK